MPIQRNDGDSNVQFSQRSGSWLAPGLIWFPSRRAGIDEHDAWQHKAGKVSKRKRILLLDNETARRKWILCIRGTTRLSADGAAISENFEFSADENEQERY